MVISNSASMLLQLGIHKIKERVVWVKAFLFSGYTFEGLYAPCIGTFRIWEQRKLILLPFSEVSFEIMLHLVLCLSIRYFFYLWFLKKKMRNFTV